MRALKVPCKIPVRSADAQQRLGALVDQLCADAVRPLEFKCLRCALEWEAAWTTADWKTVHCSNCYSDRVILTVVEMRFYNWGKQNGGVAERNKRYEAARLLGVEKGG